MNSNECIKYKQNLILTAYLRNIFASNHSCCIFSSVGKTTRRKNIYIKTQELKNEYEKNIQSIFDFTIMIRAAF